MKVYKLFLLLYILFACTSSTLLAAFSFAPTAVKVSAPQKVLITYTGENNGHSTLSIMSD